MRILFTDLNEDVIKALQHARRVTKQEIEDEDEGEESEIEDKKVAVNDMKNCFGFDVSYFL